MTKHEHPPAAALYSWQGQVPLLQLLPLSLQHVLAMVVGCVTPAIVVSGVAGLSQADSVILIQSSLLMAAIATLTQIFPAFRWFGSGLPVIIGVSFSYLPALTAHRWTIPPQHGLWRPDRSAAICRHPWWSFHSNRCASFSRRSSPGLLYLPSACPSIRLQSITWPAASEPRIMDPGKTGWWPFSPWLS